MKRYDLDRLDGRDPEALRFAGEVIIPLFRAYFRPVIHGIERIPAGPALYVANHSGIIPWDAFTFFGEVWAQRGVDYVPYFLSHEVTFALPVVNQLLVPLGVVRASHENARRALAAGHKVLVYPGSDFDSFRSNRDRSLVKFGLRRGYIRLALREGVPIVPVVTEGAQDVFYILSDGQWLARALRLDRLLRAKAWPITLSIPWGLTLGPPIVYFPMRARFYQEALEPIAFERTGPEAAEDEGWVEQCHRRVLWPMQASLERLAAEHRRDCLPPSGPGPS